MRQHMIDRRKELGLTQQQVSEGIGVNRNTYSSYEIGAITPSLDVAIRIKKVLKTKEDNIFLITKVTSGDQII